MANNNIDEARIAETRALIERRVRREFGVTADSAVLPQIYQAAALCVRDEVMDVFADQRKRSQTSGDKCLVYLCAEFLIGRAFSNNLVNLGLYDTYAAALADMGYDLGEVEEQESDAGLGNGGLGRLAACFMESMATVDIADYGYGIRYVHGLFRQQMADGWQVELPETWLAHGNPWEFERRESAYEIGFGGSVETIGGYARIDNFYDKTEEQLRNMAAAGFADPYIGVESGDDAVLKRIGKGYSATQAREVLEKLDASGMPYVVNFLNGAGGHGYGLRNAQLTAELYNGLHPSMVNASMLTVVPGTPLHRAVQKGLYAESTETEKLQEVRELVRCLTCDTIFMNEHASNLFHVKCRIPETKEELLAYIDRFIEEHDEADLRRYREMITRAF